MRRIIQIMILLIALTSCKSQKQISHLDFKIVDRNNVGFSFENDTCFINEINDSLEIEICKSDNFYTLFFYKIEKQLKIDSSFTLDINDINLFHQTAAGIDGRIIKKRILLEKCLIISE